MVANISVQFFLVSGNTYLCFAIERKSSFLASGGAVSSAENAALDTARVLHDEPRETFL